MPSTTQLFIKYPNPVFVETGTHHGRGVTSALRAGFYEIHTIELDEKLYQNTKEKFQDCSEVRFYQGASETVLKEIIQKISSPITFWLDSHYSGNGTSRGEGNCPLIKELQMIAEHPIKTHTILIDDRRCFGTNDFDGLTEIETCELLLKINPSYHISYDYGGAGHESDVLVATLRK